MKYLLIFAILFIGFFSNAQSPFKTLPKVGPPGSHIHAMTMAVVAQPDSLLNVWRFTANVAAYGYTFNGKSQAMAGAEFGYNHEKWNYTTSKWVTQWSVNGAWFPINSATAITSLQQLESIAVLVGLDNNLIQFGPMLNPNAPHGQQFGICISLGITLNN